MGAAAQAAQEEAAVVIRPAEAFWLACSANVLMAEEEDQGHPSGLGGVQNLSKSNTFQLFYLFGDPIFVAQAAWELVGSSSPLASDSRVARLLLL